MYKKEMADLTGIGQKTKFSNRRSKTFSAMEYSSTGSNIQCKKCRSDYMKFHVEGLCQRCQQRVEFITRERQFGRKEGRR